MTSPRRLTDAIVSECCPDHSEYAVRDTAIRGFALRVQPSGSKTWELRWTIEGRPRRISLGNAESVLADQARTRAHALLAQGEAAQPVPFNHGPRFRDFEPVFRERRGSRWKPSGLKFYDTYMRVVLLPAFGKKRLAEISRAHVLRWFHDYSAHKPGGANRALDFLKAFFNCARDWGALPEKHVNPCRGITRNRRPPRGRLLNEDALTRLGVALEQYSDSLADAVDIIRLILYTGCRSGEIIRLQWVEAKSDRLTLIDAKTGPRSVHLGEPAKALLARRRLDATSAFVFPHPCNETLPRRNIDSAWRRIRRAATLSQDIRLHDLRHTFASHAVMSGESMLITGQLLGHRRTHTTARYAHLQDSFLQSAAERVGERIGNWLGVSRTNANSLGVRSTRSPMEGHNH